MPTLVINRGVIATTAMVLLALSITTIPSVAKQPRHFHPRHYHEARVLCMSTVVTCSFLNLEYVNLSFTAARWLKIAVIKPVFTATAYSSYYQFYSKYAGTPRNTPVATDLNLLNASIVNDWGVSTFLVNFLNSTLARAYGLTLGMNLQVLSDIDVHQGGLFFPNGTRRFDAAILGFTEYLTAEEYHAYKWFVVTGGTLIIMDASNFVAEVKYYPRSQHACLYRGHSWFFNGTVAVRDVFERWQKDNTNWVASNTWQQIGQNYNGSLPSTSNPIGRALFEKFGSSVFTHYHGSEENYVTNFTLTSVIAIWQKTPNETQHFVAAYLHRHQDGCVIHFGAFGSEVIAYDPSIRYFLARSVLYAAQVSLNLPRVTFYTGSPKVSIAVNNGTHYNDSQADYFLAGNLTLTAVSPIGDRFSRWQSTGELSVSTSTGDPTTLTITSSGTISAEFSQSSLSLSPLLPLFVAVILSLFLALRKHYDCDIALGLSKPKSKVSTVKLFR